MPNYVVKERSYFVRDRAYLTDAEGIGCTVCGGELQACCLPDGSCIQTTAGQCIALGGTPQGSGTDCATTNCGGPCNRQTCESVCNTAYQMVCDGFTISELILGQTYCTRFTAVSATVPYNGFFGCDWTTQSVAFNAEQCGNAGQPGGITAAIIQCALGGQQWVFNFQAVQRAQNWSLTWTKSGGDCPQGTYGFSAFSGPSGGNVIAPSQVIVL